MLECELLCPVGLVIPRKEKNMRKFIVFALASLAMTAVAQAAVTVVNPVTVAVGATVHLTPVDQNSVPIPISECTIQAFVPSIVTVSYDATGAVLTGVAPGAGANAAYWLCKAPGGSATVSSAPFTITVPWSVTTVGDTSP
jgi:hypothetical protein